MGPARSSGAVLPAEVVPRRVATRFWWRTAYALVVVPLIVVAVSLTYQPVLRDGFFVSDDHFLVRDASASWSLLPPDPWIFSGNRHPTFWRPLGTLAWRINYLVSGSSVRDFYLVNVALHLLNALLVATLLYRLRGSVVAATIAGAVFALHPMATETVSWLAARFDLVATALALMALHVHLTSGRVAAFALLWRGWAAMLFAGALLGKESVAVTPLLACLTQVHASRANAQRGDTTLVGRAMHVLVQTGHLWCIFGLYLVARTLVLGAVGPNEGYLRVDLLRTGENLLHHARMVLFVPFDADAYVTPNLYRPPGLVSPTVVVPLAVAVALSVLAPNVRFGVLFSLVALLPVATLNGGGRLVYLALGGFAIALAETLALVAAYVTSPIGRLARSVQAQSLVRTVGMGGVAVALASVLLVGYGLSAHTRNVTWARAGELVRALPARVVALYPGLPAGAHVYVRGLPDHDREVYIFRNITELRFDVDRLGDYAPDVTATAWHSPHFATIRPVTSFPAEIPREDACRTFFAQYDDGVGTVSWQPVPTAPNESCRTAEQARLPAGSVPVGVTFGDAIQLVAYALGPQTVAGGQQIQIDLVWRTSAPVERDLKTFIHIASADRRPLAQRDAEPYDGRFPTSVWSVGLTLRDRHRLTIPDQLPPGEYEVLVGLYASPDGPRLPITSGQQPSSDAIRLTTLRVTR